jgi:hypothetical protein
MSIKNKKGQLDQLGTLAVGIAVLAITLTIAFLVISEGEEQAADLISATTVTNESVAGWSDNVTRAVFAFGPNAVDSSVSCSQVWNGTTGGIVASTNYTCTNLGIIFVGDNSTGGWNGTALITYTYQAPSYAVNGTRALANATDDVPGWIPLIVITVIGALLLGLVAMFRKNQ